MSFGGVKDIDDCLSGGGGNVVSSSGNRFSSTTSKKTYTQEEYMFLYANYEVLIKQSVYSYFGTDIYKETWKIKIRDDENGDTMFFITALIDYLIFSGLNSVKIDISKKIKDMKYISPYFNNLTTQLDMLYKQMLAVDRSIKAADLVCISRDIKDISGSYVQQDPDEIAEDVVKLVDDVSSALEKGGVVGAAGGLKIDTLKPSMPPLSLLETAVKRFCLLTKMPEGVAYTLVNNGYTHGVNLKIQIYEQDTFYTTFYNQLINVMVYLKQILDVDFKITEESRVDSIDKLLIKYQDTMLVINQLTYLTNKQKLEITKLLLSSSQDIKNSDKKGFELEYDESLDKKEIAVEKQHNTKNKRV